MKVAETRLPGVLLIEPAVFGDSRGFFMESWSQERYAAAGIPERFVQDNVSYSARGILRGLHYQEPCAQGKLVSVLRGEVYDVAVDIRRGSPHFGRWVGCTLSAENKRQLYIPEGFAHGFLVTGEDALFAYKVTTYYRPDLDRAIAWNDPTVRIEWPTDSPVLSAKDGRAPRLGDVPPDHLPTFGA